MRLSQIGRKLNTTQSDIIKTLESLGEIAPTSGNSKLTDNQIALLYKAYKYNPEEEKEEVVEEAEIKEEIVEPVTKEEPIIEVEEIIEETPIVEEVVTPKEDETPKTEPIEVIRAKKIKLEGIKVLGKIELPEKPVKETPEAIDTETNQEEKSTKKVVRIERQRKPSRHKHSKKPLTFDEKQALEEKNKLREKRSRERKLKEKKKEYFEKNIKPKQEKAGTKKKKNKKKEIDNNSTSKRTKITTKNPFKRFWLWLNDTSA
jgi:hypothetical protein